MAYIMITNLIIVDTLNSEVIGSNPQMITLLVLPKGEGWIVHVKPAAFTSFAEIPYLIRCFSCAR